MDKKGVKIMRKRQVLRIITHKMRVFWHLFTLFYNFIIQICIMQFNISFSKFNVLLEQCMFTNFF